MKLSRWFAAAALVSSTAGATLQPGDLAFTAFNADEDGFAVVALRPIPAFSTIYFSDNEWQGGAPGVGAFTTGENIFAWISGTEPLAAGRVVRFSAIDQAARASSAGAFGLIRSGTPGFAATGDTLFAYLGDGTGVPSRFLAAISTEGFAGSSLDGTGLTIGAAAVAIGNGADFGEYTGARSGAGAFAAYAAMVNDAALWTSRATGDFAATVPNLTAFEIAPVPEPETYALLCTGLALIGWQLRSRARGLRPITPCAHAAARSR